MNDIIPHRLPTALRDQLQIIYNAHLFSPAVDPFKLAIFKLMGKFDPLKRSIPLVTATTEDWLWFQFAMVGCWSNWGATMNPLKAG